MNTLELINKHSQKLLEFYKVYILRNEVQYFNIQSIHYSLSRKISSIMNVLTKLNIGREVTVGKGKTKLTRLKCITTPNELLKLVKKSFEKSYDLYITVNLGTCSDVSILEEHDLSINIEPNDKTNFTPFLIDRVVLEFEYKQKRNNIVDKLRKYAVEVFETCKKYLDVEPLIVFTGTKSIHVHVLLRDLIFVRNVDEFKAITHVFTNYILENISSRFRRTLRKLMDRKVTYDIKRVVRVPFANRVDGEYIRVWYVKNGDVRKINLENLYELRNISVTAASSEVIEFMLNEARFILRTGKLREFDSSNTVATATVKRTKKGNTRLSLEDKWQILIDTLIKNNIKFRDCRKRFAHVLGRWCFRKGIELSKCMELASLLIEGFDTKYAKIIQSQYNDRYAQYLMNPFSFISKEEWYTCTEETEIIQLVHELFKQNKRR